MCVLILSTTSVRNISNSKKKRAKYDFKMYIGLHIKNMLFLTNVNETRISSADFRKLLKKQI